MAIPESCAQNMGLRLLENHSLQRTSVTTNQMLGSSFSLDPKECLRLHVNGRNNSQHCWDLQCIVGRIQPISLCKPCVMSVRGPNNVGRAVQTDPTLLRYASAITEQKKCWELLAEKFDRFQTLRNNTQQHPTTCKRVCKQTQHVTSNNVGSCWSTMLRSFARSLTMWWENGVVGHVILL